MNLPREPQAVTLTGHNGLAINVWDYGGDGPPLLLAHCTGTLGRVWDVVVAELDDQFRVVAPDTRGQGDSEVPAAREDYAWSLSGRDLLCVAEHFQFGEKGGAVGHSAGGAHVAYAEHFAPGIFGKIMLIDPVIVAPSAMGSGNKLAEVVRRRINTFESREAARERLTAKPPMEHWVPGATERYLEHAFVVEEGGNCHLKCPGTREAWYYELGGANDLYDALTSIGVETCLVTGEHSYAKAWVADQHARLPNSTIETVAGAGHFIPQEKPVETAALITAWFGSPGTPMTSA